mgnify:CR=1 FL=1
MEPLNANYKNVKTEKFMVFRNAVENNPRLESLSLFSFRNKKIINKIIKSKKSLFITEMEGAIKHMSNVLDFENKRTYFK